MRRNYNFRPQSNYLSGNRQNSKNDRQQQYSSSSMNNDHQSRGRSFGGRRPMRQFDNEQGSYGQGRRGYGDNSNNENLGSEYYSPNEYYTSDYSTQAGYRSPQYDRDNFGGGARYGSGTGYGVASTYGSNYNQDSNLNYGGWDTTGYGGGTSTYGSSSSPYSQQYRNRDFQQQDYYQDRAQNRGQYYGRTPKGFTRSDERIREEISEQLMRLGEFDPSDISIQVESGTVTLEGTVDSRQAKYRVEEMAENILGVKDVENHLKIKRSSSSQYASSEDETMSSSNGEDASSSGSGTTSSASSSRNIGSVRSSASRNR